MRSFGAPVIEPPGKHARTHSTGVRSRSSTPVIVEISWCTVVYGSTTMNCGTPHGVDLAHAPEIVAQQVHDHQMLGERLLVVQQPLAQLPRRAAGRRERGAVPLIGRACTLRSRSIPIGSAPARS